MMDSKENLKKAISDLKTMSDADFLERTKNVVLPESYSALDRFNSFKFDFQGLFAEATSLHKDWVDMEHLIREIIVVPNKLEKKSKTKPNKKSHPQVALSFYCNIAYTDYGREKHIPV